MTATRSSAAAVRREWFSAQTDDKLCSMLHGIRPFSHRNMPDHASTGATIHMQTWHDEFDLDAISPAKRNNAR